MHNRGYLRRQEYLKNKRKKAIAKYQHGFPGIYYDEQKGRIVTVDAHELKKFVKRSASKKIRRSKNIPMRGKGYRKAYNVDNMLW